MRRDGESIRSYTDGSTPVSHSILIRRRSNSSGSHRRLTAATGCCRWGSTRRRRNIRRRRRRCCFADNLEVTSTSICPRLGFSQAW